MQLWGKRNWLISSSNFTKRKNLTTCLSPSKQYDTDYFLHCTIPDWISSSQPQFPSLTWLPNFWITHNNKLWCTLKQTANPKRNIESTILRNLFRNSVDFFCTARHSTKQCKECRISTHFSERRLCGWRARWQWGRRSRSWPVAHSISLPWLWRGRSCEHLWIRHS